MVAGLRNIRPSRTNKNPKRRKYEAIQNKHNAQKRLNMLQLLLSASCGSAIILDAKRVHLDMVRVKWSTGGSSGNNGGYSTGSSSN